MKAKINGETITPDFLYHVVEVKGVIVLLGWNGRRGDWNETDRRLSQVTFFEDDSPEFLLQEERIEQLRKTK